MYGPQNSVNESLMGYAFNVFLVRFYLVFWYPCMTSKNVTSFGRKYYENRPIVKVQINLDTVSCKFEEKTSYSTSHAVCVSFCTTCTMYK